MFSRNYYVILFNICEANGIGVIRTVRNCVSEFDLAQVLEMAPDFECHHLSLDDDLNTCQLTVI